MTRKGTIRKNNQTQATEWGVYLPPFEAANHPLQYPPGAHFKYRLPLPLQDRLRLTLGKTISFPYELSPTEKYPIAPEWQLLSHYLFAHGILKTPQITFDPIAPNEPKLYALRLWAANSVTDGAQEIMQGGYSRGISGDHNEALSKVFGELLERYPLSIYRDRDLYRASIEDLESKRAHFLDPRLADLSSGWQKKQFPRRTFSTESIFRFVKGYSLTKKREALIPAQLVFMNYRTGEGEPLLRESNSSGAGGMFTRERAILSGLYELVQRDTFLLHWLQKRTPEKINPVSIQDPRLQYYLGECEKSGLEVHLLRLNSEFGIPVHIAVLISKKGDAPALSLGGGCGDREEDSLLRALAEALSVRVWQKVNHPPEDLPAMDLTEPFMHEWGSFQRQFIWYDKQHLPKIEFLLTGPLVSLEAGHASNKSPQQELKALLRSFSDKGPEFEVFLYEARHEILTDLGYHSVKVCIPTLLPLYMNETFAPLGSSRIKPFGYKEPDVKEINTLPHPFP